MTKPIVDQQARDKIKEVLNKNFLVEAGAGSGKTTSLVERMVNLIYTGTAKVEEIVAITFTRKAADELKTRFLSKLEETYKKETDSIKKSLLEQALQNIEQCFLGTVHSFCARLLRERPVEAGLDVNFSELEEDKDNQLAEDAWFIYIQKLQDENSQKLRFFKDLVLDEAELKKRFCFMKNYPDVQWAKNYVEKPNLEETYHSFIALLKEASRCIPEDPPKGPDDMQKAIKEALRLHRYRPKGDQVIIEVFELFAKKKSFGITQYKWTSKEDAKDYQARMKQFHEDRIQPLLAQWKEYCHPYIIDFFKGAFTEYEKLKQERSLLNFQDLLMKTAALLKDNSEVRLYFQNKYKRLLVDEFQDTDPIQAEIMFYLTGENTNETNWTNCVPLPGSLFVVGDPKQAIYRFRRADIDIYNLVKELIEAHGGDVLQLTMNFRTLDTITTQLNDVFINHLPEKETVYQAAYRPLHSYKEDDGSTFTGIKKLVIPEEFSSNKAQIVQKDAESIAAYILAKLKQGHMPKEFMILTRYNDGIDVYAKVLEARGIPVSVSGEMVIGNLPVFQDLLRLLTALTDTTDQVAFVASLRSVWFGISDEELYQWRQAGGAFSIYAEVPDNLQESTKIHFQDALAKLRLYTKWKTSLSPVVAIEKVIEDIGLYPLFLMSHYGSREITNLRQILEALRAKEESGVTTYSQSIDYIKEQIEAKTKVINLEEDNNAVRIMNVHKAKGLEAGIVFLAHPGKKPDISNYISSHIKREEERSTGYFMFSKKQGPSSKPVAQPLNWEHYKEIEAEYLLEEEIRILYVAATRAEKAMIISTCASAKKNSKNPWNLLLEGLPELEELVIPEMEETPIEVTSEPLTLTEYQKETQQLLEWIDDRRVPSYSKVTPTEEKQDIFTLGIEREEGGGLTWGTVVHEVFEKVVKGEETEEVIVSSLQKHEISLERVEEIAQAVTTFQQSEVWQEIKQAEQVLTEVPFTLKVESHDSLYKLVKKSDDKSETIFVSGVIDLVYKINGAWKIVDYKTDRPKDISYLPELTNYYKDQIGMYQVIWERMTGETVTEKQLYFVTPNQIVEV
ncbi:UvrD-helicase domain-containing protein [Fredinandcohnia sp. 179-A 10B2 NHS]|uniref:UvrD-helicase domain-containing protein n=1 Tax=Fredinandcohnia sp. 179-A 10B2 NHS TaxID=3235176 RepID=UPI00399F5504